jgi:hypothetical protein
LFNKTSDELPISPLAFRLLSTTSFEVFSRKLGFACSGSLISHELIFNSLVWTTSEFIFSALSRVGLAFCSKSVMVLND